MTNTYNNVSKEKLPWFKEVVTQEGAIIESQLYKSKYNSYVVYDYEPFCSDGFTISIEISAPTKNHLKFIKYLYENQINNIEYLKRCLVQS